MFPKLLAITPAVVLVAGSVQAIGIATREPAETGPPAISASLSACDEVSIEESSEAYYGGALRETVTVGVTAIEVWAESWHTSSLVDRTIAEAAAVVRLFLVVMRGGMPDRIVIQIDAPYPRNWQGPWRHPGRAYEDSDHADAELLPATRTVRERCHVSFHRDATQARPDQFADTARAATLGRTAPTAR